METITPEYMKADLEKVSKIVYSVKCGKSTEIAVSAGKRPVYMVEYEKNTLPPSKSNLFSALGSGDASCYADRTSENYIPTLMLVGCIHDGEFE